MAQVVGVAIASEDLLSQLHEALLAAVLSGAPLPGRSEPVRLPDLAFVTSGDSVVLVDENLPADLTLPESPKAVRVLSREALLEEARERGDVAYLAFRPAEVAGDRVRLTLEARIAPGDPSRLPLGLSAIHVTFQEVDGEWRAVGEPVASAM